MLIHSLFGRIITEKKLYCAYDIKLISLEGDFSFNIKVLDQKIICPDIPTLRKGFCNEELRENEIWLTDYEESCPNIDLLIRVDYCGKICQLKSYMFACETYLGQTNII